MKSSPEGPVSRAAVAELPLFASSSPEPGGRYGAVLSGYRVEPQSVAAGGSPEGAAKVRPRQQDQCEAIIAALMAAGCYHGTDRYLSREQVCERVGLSVNAACGRLAPSGPLQTLRRITTKDGGCVSSSGVRVLGYQLSATFGQVSAA